MIGVRSKKGRDLLLTGHHEGSVVAGVHEGRMVDCQVGSVWCVGVHEGLMSAMCCRFGVPRVHVGLGSEMSCREAGPGFHEGTVGEIWGRDRRTCPLGAEGATPSVLMTWLRR